MLSRGRARSSGRPQPPGRSPLWTLIGGLVASTLLFWLMVQLGQASSEAKTQAPAASWSSGRPAPANAPGGFLADDSDLDERALAPPAPAVQGPAVDQPREILDMLALRKRDLDRREEVVREHEDRLSIIRGEIEQLLARNEVLDKRMQEWLAQQTGANNPEQEKKAQERERQALNQKMQLAKMYESMPPEDAAARLERMPERQALEILRLVKSKTAGSILAQVKVDRAAKLTEQLLIPSPSQ